MPSRPWGLACLILLGGVPSGAEVCQSVLVGEDGLEGGPDAGVRRGDGELRAKSGQFEDVDAWLKLAWHFLLGLWFLGARGDLELFAQSGVGG